MAETFTLYKLIILYMLSKVDFPLANAQISDFVLGKGYTTYFTLQKALSELTESGLIREETTHNRTMYHLTEEGAESICFFENKISDAIKKDIEDFVTPQSYIYLDNRPTLLKYMEKKIVRKGLNIKHDFSSITSDQICRC